MKNEKSLRPRQIQAIRLLVSGQPACEVAERLDVSEMTIYRWQKLPAFESKLRAVATSGLEELAKKMNATSLTAVETLQEVLCDLTLPTGLRVKAALGVVNAMSSVNAALEKSLKHHAADFDPANRFGGPPYTYDGSGSRIDMSSYKDAESVVTI